MELTSQLHRLLMELTRLSAFRPVGQVAVFAEFGVFVAVTVCFEFVGTSKFEGFPGDRL